MDVQPATADMNAERHATVGSCGDVLIVEPSGDAPHAAVICVQAASIEVPEALRSAQLLAGDRYVTIVPDRGAFVADVPARTAELRDWLNTQPNVRPNHIAVWTFGGTIGAVAAAVPGLAASVIFQSDADADESGDWWPAVDPAAIRCPLLLVLFTQLADDAEQIRSLRDNLTRARVRFELQTYPVAGDIAPAPSRPFDAKSVADAWDLVGAFLGRSLDD